MMINIGTKIGSFLLKKNDDAMYYNRLDLAIYGSIDKHERFKLGSSLEEFFKVLTRCMKLQQEKYGMNLQDETEAPLPEFISDLQRILDDNYGNKEENAGFMQFFFG